VRAQTEKHVQRFNTHPEKKLSMSYRFPTRMAVLISTALVLVNTAAAQGQVDTRKQPVVAASVVAASRVDSSQSTPKPPDGFTDRYADVNGIRVHYVAGGAGPTLVLLHGYPQTSYEWFDVMPALAEKFTVIPPDLRGAGATTAPEGGYDKKTMAKDLRGLLVSLGKEANINLVCHDIGTMVAYAYAYAYGDSVSKLVLSEAPIPDSTVYSYPALTPNGPGFWNFGFFSLKNGPRVCR
jgi:hypothetical protein